MKGQKLNRKQAKWALYLSRFNFILKYILESKIEKTNSLSRRLNQKVGIERGNKNEMLVKPEQLKVRKIKRIEVIVEGVDLLEKVKQSKVKNNKVVKAAEEIKQAGVKILRAKMIRLYYDIPVEGHRGQQKIVELVTQNFQQLGVTKEIKQYVEGCDFYQRNKTIQNNQQTN